MLDLRDIIADIRWFFRWKLPSNLQKLLYRIAYRRGGEFAVATNRITGRKKIYWFHPGGMGRVAIVPEQINTMRALLYMEPEPTRLLKVLDAAEAEAKK